MSDTVPTPADIAPKVAEEQSEKDAQTFDAEYVDKLRKEAAKYRTEAKANAEAAARLAQIEEAQKTAEERAAEKMAQLEREAAELRAQATRAEMAAETGIPASLLAGPSDSSVEAVKAFADLIAAHVEQSDALRKQRSNFAPLEGNPPAQPLADDRYSFVENLVANKRT